MVTVPFTGIDSFLEGRRSFEGQRVGLLANQASRTAKKIPTAQALQTHLGSALTCLFSPEHGWTAKGPEGEEGQNSRDLLTGLPVYSLYGGLLQQTLEIVKTLDVFIIDLQDVGVRCYTYAATCAKVLAYISQENLPLDVFVCDRPNPLGKTVKGSKPIQPFRSLVSYLDVPFQHGKTLGELLSDYNQTLEGPVSLSVIHSREEFNPEVHSWIPPSPGLPDWESVFLYPGLVLLEGTNISEGRGSPHPFKCLGAPGLDSQALLNQLGFASGALPYHFTPTRSKFQGHPCEGIQFQGKVEDGYSLGLRLLTLLPQIYPSFEWIRLGENYWIDELMGGPDFRLDVSSFHYLISP